MTLALVGCAAVQAPPGVLPAMGLTRFYQVAPGIYRSAQPTPNQFIDLAVEYGVKSVVKLNYAWESPDVLPAGVEQFEHPMSAFRVLSHEDVLSVCRDVDAAPKPVIIHCEHGQDRTGLIVALCVRLRVQDGDEKPAMLPSPQVAFNEAVAYGFHRSLVALTAAFERETGVDP